MLAVYADSFSRADPLSCLRTGEHPEPIARDGWVRVRISHASLNRHDIFTLQGITHHSEAIPLPMILGNDGAGTLDDGTPVVLYPVMGSEDWRDDETLDPQWHIFSEKIPGTFADWITVPRRNAVPLPQGISLLEASVLGTAWLTAYRALTKRSGLSAGKTLLVNGASGGMATALIQLGRAAGFEVWARSRSREGRELAESLGAHRVFSPSEALPHKVHAVVDNVGSAAWGSSLSSIVRGGTIVTTGFTSGFDVEFSLLPVVSNQITIAGSVLGTLQEMKDLIRFIVNSGIRPQIGQVLPMERAAEGFRAMWEGRAKGKIVFTR